MDWAALKVPTPVDIGLLRGDTRNFIFIVYDGNGALVDCTGATISFTVKSGVGGTQLFQLTTGGGTVTIATSEVTAAVAASNTSTATPGTYYYDLQIVLGGNTITSAWGDFIIAGDIT